MQSVIKQRYLNDFIKFPQWSYRFQNNEIMWMIFFAVIEVLTQSGQILKSKYYYNLDAASSNNRSLSGYHR